MGAASGQAASENASPSGRRRGLLGARTRGTLALPCMVRSGGGTPLFRGFLVCEPADNCLLELSAATSEALLNGLSKAAVPVTDSKTSNLSGNVSRVASQGMNPALSRHK
jgi:hypothetical protein